MDKIKKLIKKSLFKPTLIWIAAVYVILAVITVVIYQTNSDHITISQCTSAFLTFPFHLIALIIYFSPAIIAVMIVFHFTKNMENSNFRKILRILSISFFFPCNNYVYFYILSKITNDTLPLIPVIAGLYCLFIILPLTTILSVIMPKKYFETKWLAFITSILVFITGWIFIFGTITTEEEIDRLKEYHELSYYNSTIDFIEEHGERFHRYPKLIGEIYHKGKYNKIDYSTYNNNQDYILRVYQDDENGTSFRYCSSKNLPDCDERNQEQFLSRELIGGWVKTEPKKD